MRNLEVETAASFYNFDANFVPARLTMKLVATWLSPRERANDGG